MDSETRQKLKTALEQEKTKLASELKFIAVPNPDIKGDWQTKYPKFEEQEFGSHASEEEEANEVEEYEEMLEAEHTLESRLLEITRALERMEKGTYGICATCEKEIAADRLNANPAAEFCQEHQLL